jgi:hypothetical protein
MRTSVHHNQVVTATRYDLWIASRAILDSTTLLRPPSPLAGSASQVIPLFVNKLPIEKDKETTPLL